MEKKHLTKKIILIFVLFFVISLEYLNSKSSILIIYSGGKFFEKTIQGIEFETEKDFLIYKIILKKKNALSQIENKIANISPKAIILIDNRSIEYFHLYQNKIKKNKLIPSISIMAINVGMALKKIHNTKGISYEIPIVTSLINLRSIIKKPFKRIGIINRTFLNEFINKNKEYCKNEGFIIENVEIPDLIENPKRKIKNGLDYLIKAKHIEALWIPNDNVLITNKLLRSVWLPYMNKRKIPVIVGVEALANPKVNFAVLAVIPDHISLGSQTAQILYDLKDNKWVFNKFEIDPPISVKTILNLKKAKRNFKIRKEALFKIDKVIE